MVFWEYLLDDKDTGHALDTAQALMDNPIYGSNWSSSDFSDS